MAKTFTIQDFFKRFPTDDACLDHLFHTRYGEQIECPKCAKQGKFHRIRKRPVYECAWCGHQVSPMVGTPFARSHTALQKWFYAMYLFTTTRHGVSAKELQRQLGVTYKTAWRMGHEIRKYMGKVDGDTPLSGHVEVDETWVGGKTTKEAPRANKTVVFGMVEREGSIITRVVDDVRRVTLERHILKFIRKGSRISSDEFTSYLTLRRHGYDHRSVNHKKKEYARGQTHTNTLEGFWSLLKRSIRSTHIHVSKQHLAKYLGEFEYRHNMRGTPEIMFSRLLLAFSRVST